MLSMICPVACPRSQWTDAGNEPLHLAAIFGKAEVAKAGGLTRERADEVATKVVFWLLWCGLP